MRISIVAALALIVFPYVSPSPIEENAPDVSCSPTSQSVVQCLLLNVIKDKPRFDVDVVVNQCHDPVDITFYLRSSKYSWNFTYVPNNQNERVYIPDIYLNPPAHEVPSYLYVREPEKEFNNRKGNTSGTRITVLASIVAVYRSMWEEEEFMNHTFVMSERKLRSCPTLTINNGHSLPQWVLYMIIQVTLVPIIVAFAAVIGTKYRQNRRHVPDNLNLVRNAQAPASQPSVNLNETRSAASEGSKNITTSTVENNNNPRLNKDRNEANNLCHNSDEANANINAKTVIDKLKQSLKISVRMPLSFKKLSEEQEENSNKISQDQTGSNEVSITTPNPTYLSKNNQRSISSVNVGEKSDNTVGINDSKNNLYYEDANEDCSTRQDLDRGQVPNGTFPNAMKNVNKFEYGSRDYLDQLESSSAVVFTLDNEVQPSDSKSRWKTFNDSYEDETVKPEEKRKKSSVHSEEAKRVVNDAISKGVFSYDVNETAPGKNNSRLK